jgi:hypothetical protein
VALSFKTWLTEHIAPVWLRRTWGNRWLTVMGEQADRTTDTAKEAVKAGAPDLSPSDALPYNGAARNIERYWADSDTTYRARLVDAWNVWEFSATSDCLEDRFVDEGFGNISIVPWRDMTPYAPAPYENHWSAFWIWVDTHPFTTGATWGGGATWGDTVPGHNGAPSGPRTWGSDATLYEVQAVRAAIRKWKPAAEVCAAIVFHSGGMYWGRPGTWGDGAKWGDGSTFTWGSV